MQGYSPPRPCVNEPAKRLGGDSMTRTNPEKLRLSQTNSTGRTQPEMFFFDPIVDPIVFRALNSYFLKNPVFGSGLVQADCNHPTRIVQCADLDAPLVFPIAVTLLAIPFFEESKARFHRIKLARVRPASFPAENRERKLPRCGTSRTVSSAYASQCAALAHLRASGQSICRSEAVSHRLLW